MVSTPARRELVCFIKDKGLSERRALRAARMSASAYCYKPAADKSCVKRLWRWPSVTGAMELA